MLLSLLIMAILTWARAKRSFQTDVTWHKTGSLGLRGAKALPAATVEYVVEKVPIVGWLPHYNYKCKKEFSEKSITRDEKPR